MPAVTVSVTDKQREYLESKVASGDYGNMSEVVREALRLLEREDQERAAKIRDLRAAIQAGIDSGPAEPWEGAEAITRLARERRAARRSVNTDTGT